MEQETLLLSLPFFPSPTGAKEREEEEVLSEGYYPWAPQSFPSSFILCGAQGINLQKRLHHDPTCLAHINLKLGETVDHEGVTRLLLENLQ